MKLLISTAIMGLSLLVGSLVIVAGTKAEASDTTTVNPSTTITKKLPASFLREEVPVGFGDDGGGGGQDWSIWPEP